MIGKEISTDIKSGKVTITTKTFPDYPPYVRPKSEFDALKEALIAKGVVTASDIEAHK